MEGSRTQKLRVSRFGLAAGLSVAVAGAVAWFGLADGQDASRPEADAADVTPLERNSDAPGSLLMDDGSLPTRVVIVSAGIDAAVSEVGVAVENGRPVWQTAWRSAGHHLDSARPGQPGNMVMSGHVSVADTDNVAVFARLDAVHPGDLIEVYSGDRSYRYQVAKVVVVDPSAVKLLRSSPSATITLVTCTKDLKKRLVVVGTLMPAEAEAL